MGVALSGKPHAAYQRAAEQLSQISRLVVALNRREYQLNGPFGGHAFGFQRIGQTKAANHNVWPRRTAAVKLVFNVLDRKSVV